MYKPRNTIFLVVIMILVCTLMTGCGGSDSSNNPNPDQPSALQKELEAKGGVRVVFDPQKEDLTEAELNSVQTILGNRLTSVGYLKRIMTVNGSGDIVVDIINDNGAVNLADVQTHIDFISKIGLLTGQEVDVSNVDDRGNYRPTGQIVFDGRNIIDAVVSENPPYKITITLNAAGSGKLMEDTGRLVGKPIGIFMDSQFLASQNIQVRIDDGIFVFQDGVSREEALEHCTTIKLGPLPTGLTRKQMITVSPKI